MPGVSHTRPCLHFNRILHAIFNIASRIFQSNSLRNDAFETTRLCGRKRKLCSGDAPEIRDNNCVINDESGYWKSNTSLMTISKHLFCIRLALNGSHGEYTNSDDVESKGIKMCTKKGDSGCANHYHKTKFKKPASTGAARRIQEKVKLCKPADLELCTINDCLNLYPYFDHWHMSHSSYIHSRKRVAESSDPKTPPGLNLPYKGKMTGDILEKLNDYIEDTDTDQQKLEQVLETAESKMYEDDESNDETFNEAMERMLGWIDTCDKEDKNEVKEALNEVPTEVECAPDTIQKPSPAIMTDATLNEVPTPVERVVRFNPVVEQIDGELNNVPTDVECEAVNDEMSESEYLELLRFLEDRDSDEEKFDDEEKSDDVFDGKYETHCLKRDELDDECGRSEAVSDSTLSLVSEGFLYDPGYDTESDLESEAVIEMDPWFNDLDEVVIYTTYDGLKPKGFNERLNYWLNGLIFGKGKNVLHGHVTTKTVVAGTKRKGLLTYLFGHYDHYSIKKTVNNTENYRSQYRARIKRSYLDYLIQNWKVTLLSVSGTSIEYQPAAILVALRTEFGDEIDDLRKMEVVVNTINYYVSQMKLFESALFSSSGYNVKIAGKHGSDLLTLIDQARQTK